MMIPIKNRLQQTMNSDIDTKKGEIKRQEKDNKYT